MSTYRKQRITQAMRQGVARRLLVEPGSVCRRPCIYCSQSLIVDWRDPERVRFLDSEGRATPELDHVHSLANGGPHVVENIVLACLRCNRRKGAASGFPGSAMTQLQEVA